jgi:DNA-binding transcriptional LysR family regulator
MLDLDMSLLRTFTVVAELKSFTAAGELLGATQSAISLRMAKLEELVGKALLARTSRAVSLTPEGARFLEMARASVAAHDAAISSVKGVSRTIVRLALSDHAVGAHLGSALLALRASSPSITCDVMVGLSAEMRDLYDQGDADVAIVRQDDNRHKGVPLYDDPLVWVQGSGCDWTAGMEIPLIALRGPCGVKAATTKALDAARMPWRFSFLGGSVSALQAAVEAGLGLSVVGRRQASARVVGVAEGLPELPKDVVVMHTRLVGEVARSIRLAFTKAGS